MALGRLEAGESVRTAVKSHGLRWADLAEALGRSTEWTVSALLGQQPITRDQAATVAKLLQLDDKVTAALTLPPVRGESAVDTSEPVVYRLQEVIQVYGSAIAELIAESFGDGIMSAIDFELSFTRVPDPKGDRVMLTLNGKFLPYRVW